MKQIGEYMGKLNVADRKCRSIPDLDRIAERTSIVPPLVSIPTDQS